ncbi:MAG: hypothetical protein HZB51_24970 [Chloroflexi bacterium]|nr:hypothetical protein [Chloroflexota bacterium]
MNRTIIKALPILVLVLIILSMPKSGNANPAAATFIVDSNADAGDWNPGDGICETANGNHVCTLRAAVQEANAAPGSTIIFGLAGSITYLLTSQVALNANMTIVGNGAANTIIDGNGSVTNNRVFTISSAPTVVSISGVTIRNGKSDLGGGIHNVGHLLLNNVIVMNNAATIGNPRSGGGIWNSGALTITQSLINGNTATIPFTGGGGGIYNTNGTVLLDHTSLNGNTTDFLGGAIQVDGGIVSLVNSAIDSNTASMGGGIFNGGISSSGILNITSSGIFSNTATSGSTGGGGIYNLWGTATLVNSTLYLNVANNNGGGIYNDSSGTTGLYNVTIAGNYSDWDSNNTGTGGGISRQGGTVNVRNSIVAGNYDYSNACLTCSTADDCKGTINSEDFNLVQTTSGCSLVGSTGNNITGVVPQLSYPPAYNGGSTLNLALQSTSQAIDAGNTGGCRDILGALISVDQRGSRRPFPNGGRCDIGAFEFGNWIFLPLIMR